MKQTKEITRIWRELKEIDNLQKLAEERRLRANYDGAKWLWITKNREQQNRGLKQEPYPEHLKSFDNFCRRKAGRQFSLDRVQPIVTRNQFLKRKQERHWET